MISFGIFDNYQQIAEVSNANSKKTSCNIMFAINSFIRMWRVYSQHDGSSPMQKGLQYSTAGLQTVAIKL